MAGFLKGRRTLLVEGRISATSENASRQGGQRVLCLKFSFDFVNLKTKEKIETFALLLVEIKKLTPPFPISLALTGRTVLCLGFK